MTRNRIILIFWYSFKVNIVVGKVQKLLTYPWMDVWMKQMLPLILVQFLKDSMFVALTHRVLVRSLVPRTLHTGNNSQILVPEANCTEHWPD